MSKGKSLVKRYRFSQKKLKVLANKYKFSQEKIEVVPKGKSLAKKR
jgi:hypothetical protein